MKFWAAAFIYKKLYAMNAISLLQIMVLCSSVLRLCVSPNMTEEDRKMTPLEWLHQGLHDNDEDLPSIEDVKKDVVKMMDNADDISEEIHFSKCCRKSELIEWVSERVFGDKWLCSSFNECGFVIFFREDFS